MNEITINAIRQSILEIEDSIKALTERVDRIEAVITHHLKYHVLRNKED